MQAPRRAAGQRRRSAADREAGDLSLGVIGASRTGPFTQSTPFPISPDKIAPCFHLPPHLSCASLVFGAFGTREASASRSRKDAEGNRRKERKKKHKQEESEGAQVVFLHFGLKVRVLPPLFARCHVGNMQRGGVSECFLARLATGVTQLYCTDIRDCESSFMSL